MQIVEHIVHTWMSLLILRKQLGQPVVVHASENSVAIVYFSMKQIDPKQLRTAKWCSNIMIDKQKCDLISKACAVIANFMEYKSHRI